MAAIAAWIAQAVGSLLAFGAGEVAKRLAVTAAIVAALGAAVLALTAAINGALSSIIVAAPGGAVAQGLQLLPSNTGQCLSALLIAHAAAWVYRQHFVVLTLKSRA